MPRNICLAFGRFGSLFLLTASVSADVVYSLLSGCCSSGSLAMPMASSNMGWDMAQTRRMGMPNEGVQQPKAPRFSYRYLDMAQTRRMGMQSEGVRRPNAPRFSYTISGHVDVGKLCLSSD